jgi:OOP family OmpA-OmpF porin
MTKQLNAALCLSISLAFALSACKPKPPAAPVEAPLASAPAAATVAPVVPAQPAAAAAPAPTSAASAAGNAAGADLDKIAVLTKPLPPFPFINYPATVGEAFQSTKESDFDQLHVLVGNKLHTVEGRFRLIAFDLSNAKISQFQAQRDYTKAALDMGGIKVNTITPADENFVAANGGDSYLLDKKLKFETRMSYEVYFLPTPTGRKWLVVMVSESDVRVLSIEEKQSASSVNMVTSAVMQSELESKGHIALYINFDTDKAAIRPDGKPAVNEIAALMKKESALHLSVEGHTDNVGDKARNKTLSRERAQAVVQALVSDGIDGTRLSAAGYGSEKPLTDNGSDEARAKNRRVELVKVARG